MLYSADGSVEDAKYALGNLLGRLQVWLREIRSMRVSDLADEVVRIKIDYAARLAATKWWMSSS